jgi:hypothetical protein
MLRILSRKARNSLSYRMCKRWDTPKFVLITSPVRQALRTQFHTLWYRARRLKGLRVFALGQRLCHFADHVATTAGATNGARVRRWFQDKKAGWYAVLEDSQMPVTSTLLDQAHNAMNRKLFMMKSFHRPDGSQQAFLTGLAHLPAFRISPYDLHHFCVPLKAL